MTDTIRYLNTDLDLASPDELAPRAAALEARGLLRLHVSRRDDGLCHATFEDGEQHDEPAPNVAAMLAVVESLERPLRALWDGCVVRRLDAGYECGARPWGFGHELPGELLARMAALGLSLRITLYPPAPPA